MDLVIVESPAKAKTINKYLGKNYKVLASYGHVRDLPSKDGSVLPDEDFSMTWEADAKSKKRLSEIAEAAKQSDRLILATDPDREGEAISWHVLQVLKSRRGVLKDKPVQRVVFNAITKESILEAMKHPRDIDVPLVDAYLARRALDYLVGFTLSPVLWRKLPGARSAGRVQSVALRLVCQREEEIEQFIPLEYWSIIADLQTAESADFQARLVAVDGVKKGRHDIANETEAADIKGLIEASSLSILSVEAKPVRRNPFAPFTTSTLQQEASRKLGFAAARTMQIAQRLYEGVSIGGETAGLITYMRTDGVQIAPEAIGPIRDAIKDEFGAQYVPGEPRVYTSKAKNAQEAHEAIRPTDIRRHPKQMAKYLDEEQLKLYTLVWRRTMASQMASAQMERTTVDILAESGSRSAELRATGSVVRFDGFLALYTESKDDEEDDEGSRLPPMTKGETVKQKAINATQHHTEPPPRFTEATLIKRMEELGIGRPSTYTATLSVLRDRGYVVLDKKRLIPEAKGRLVTGFLSNFFERYVQYDFTADLEEKLDRISAGELEWKDVLRDFWKEFSSHVDGTKELRVSQVLDTLNEVLAAYAFPPREDGKDPRACPSCDTGQLSLKTSRYGAFIGCSNYPECGYTRQLTADGNNDDQAQADGPKILGTDPDTGLEVSLRSGRFGPYVQLGDDKKPPRSSIPKGWELDSIDLEKALRLLSLPREVGLHPEDGKVISAGLGRYGPFVLHEGTYANLPSVEDIFTVGLNHAVSLLAEKRANGGARRTAQVLKDLGEHPDGGPIAVKSGRYGPYVNYGKINATLPKDLKPEEVTLEKALELIAEKAGKGGTKKAAAKKTTTKKTAAKKTTAKKTTTKKKSAAKSETEEAEDS
ncbi:type I DNA topoisomerase [uncultured Cohaesibacter sp.]|uniref:type I DNA topoisomerase n=1 Tax=uncultured Cohaesibacter sp. TaxID=1002546 RepID=UPI0029C6BCB4|nr:type I DNA topoisomerase [uncultured Cohaesibacter sp.]